MERQLTGFQERLLTYEVFSKWFSCYYFKISCEIKYIAPLSESPSCILNIEKPIIWNRNAPPKNQWDQCDPPPQKKTKTKKNKQTNKQTKQNKKKTLHILVFRCSNASQLSIQPYFTCILSHDTYFLSSYFPFPPPPLPSPFSHFAILLCIYCYSPPLLCPAR